MFKSLVMHISKCGTAVFTAFNPCSIYILFTYPQLVKKSFSNCFFVHQPYSGKAEIQNSLLFSTSFFASGYSKLHLVDGRFVPLSAAHVINDSDTGWGMRAIHGV